MQFAMNSKEYQQFGACGESWESKSPASERGFVELSVPEI